MRRQGRNGKGDRGYKRGSTAECMTKQDGKAGRTVKHGARQRGKEGRVTRHDEECAGVKGDGLKPTTEGKTKVVVVSSQQ